MEEDQILFAQSPCSCSCSSWPCCSLWDARVSESPPVQTLPYLRATRHLCDSVSAGLPLHSSDLASKAERGLGAAVAQLNSVYVTRNLYRPTSGSVTRVSLPCSRTYLCCSFYLKYPIWWQVIPSGLDTTDLLMTFGIKETVCGKDSATDPNNCAFRPGLFVVRGFKMS